MNAPIASEVLPYVLSETRDGVPVVRRSAGPRGNDFHWRPQVDFCRELELFRHDTDHAVVATLNAQVQSRQAR